MKREFINRLASTVPQGWIGVFLFAPSMIFGEELIPPPVESGDFVALKTASPFVRVLDPAETYVLRGVAAFDNIQVATLYNKESKKTLLVTPEKPNEEGLKLVEVNSSEKVEPGRELEGVSAKISFVGEEMDLKFEAAQLSPVPSQGGRGSAKTGGKGGEPRRGPSKEDIERYRSLTEEQRNKFRQYIGYVMRTYPNMSREERGNMIRGAMTRLVDGRDIEFPQGQSGGGPQGGGPQGGGQPQSQRGGDRR